MARPELREGLLPLKPLVFRILLILLDGERHGWSIVKELRERWPEGRGIRPGNFYRTLNRMTDDGMIAEAAVRPDLDEDDERRRYFQVTELGIAAARAEADRLEAVLSVARSKNRLQGSRIGLRPGEAGR